ncbi:MAG: PAS domain S-box protein [Verrucomicrobiia bacterium]
MKFQKQSAAKLPPGVRRQAGGVSAQSNAGPAAGITVRRKRQDKVALQEQQWNAFFKGATAGLVLLDKDLRIVQINDTLADLDGLSVQKHLGKTVGEVLPTVARVVEPIIRKVLATGRPILNVEVTGETPKQPGVQRHWLESYFPVAGADGTPAGVGALVVEITERKRMEEALRESEDRYRSLVVTSLDAVLLTVPDGRILGANEAACRMFGRSEKELLHLGRKGVMDASDPRLAPALEARARTGRFHGELTLIRSDGSKFPAEISSAVFCNQAGEPRISMVIRDITERKQTIKALRQSEARLHALMAQQQAVREEERIHIAREIHDTFGHALTDLKFDLAWLGRRLAEAGVGSRTAIQRRIAAMSKRVEMEMESVRRISGELRPALLDTVGLVPAIEWLAKGFQARTRIRCRMALPPAPLPLDGPRSTTIYRILQELLANVARHARATAVNIRLQAGAGWVELRVSDNGRGIPKSAVTDPHSLGLLGASERAGSLGGGLLIHGTRNQGTTVTVRLPMAEMSKKE